MVITLFRPWEKKYSSIGWRTRLLLEEKKIKYETRLVVLNLQEQQSEEILKLNPRGRLPILQDSDAVLHEESAMMHYLLIYYDEIPLMPDIKDKTTYSEALVAFHEATGVFAEVMRPVLDYLLTAEEEDEVDKEVIKNLKITVVKELYRWEKTFKNDSEYLVCNQMTFADVAFFPYLAHLVRFGLPLKKNFPKLDAYYNTLIERPSVKKTWPSGWTTTKVKPHLK